MQIEKNNTADEYSKLPELLEKNLITREEYESKKKDFFENK